jgi:hypothetical protein
MSFARCTGQVFRIKLTRSNANAGVITAGPKETLYGTPTDTDRSPTALVCGGNDLYFADGAKDKIKKVTVSFVCLFVGLYFTFCVYVW